MAALHRYTFLAALALGVLPVAVPAGEAPAPSAAAQREEERKLAEAQQKLDAAAREVAELSRQMGRRFRISINDDGIAFSPPRALLGVSVEPASGREGARVMEVSPGSAAAEAGIKSGDIITGIADLDLTKDSDPARALVEKMGKLQADQKVKVLVTRDGKKLTFDVAPRQAPQDFIARRLEGPGGVAGNNGIIIQQRGNATGGRGNGQGPEIREFRLQTQPGPGGGPAQPGIEMQRELERAGNLRERERVQSLQLRVPELGQLLSNQSDARFGGAELASLSERLGSYFGVKSGVLVVRAGVDSQFKLQDGDVLMAIDGRDITSAQQAGRILRSYQPGEKLTLKVQRDRKVHNLEITAPGNAPGAAAGARKPN